MKHVASRYLSKRPQDRPIITLLILKFLNKDDMLNKSKTKLVTEMENLAKQGIEVILLSLWLLLNVLFTNE